MADTTTIAPHTHVQGAISGDGPLHVEGSIEGHVTLTEQLTVEPSGKIHGEVRVREAIVHGRVEGTLIASERVILTSSARVIGHLEAPIIRMDDGAQFSGEVAMAIEGAAPVVKKVSAAPAARASFTTPASPPPAVQPPPTSSSSTTLSSISAASPSPSATQVAPSPQTTTTVVVEEAPEAEVEEEEEEHEEEHTPHNGEPTEYDDHTVKELREELRRRDLPVSGTKQELIERLVESAPE